MGFLTFPATCRIAPWLWRPLGARVERETGVLFPTTSVNAIPLTIFVGYTIFTGDPPKKNAVHSFTLCIVPPGADYGTLVYVRTDNQHVSGGTFEDGITDLDACRTRCWTDPQCFGVDFVWAPGWCYSLDQSISLRGLSIGPGVQHYRKHVVTAREGHIVSPA